MTLPRPPYLSEPWLLVCKVGEGTQPLSGPWGPVGRLAWPFVPSTSPWGTQACRWGWGLCRGPGPRPYLEANQVVWHTRWKRNVSAGPG